VSRLYRTCISLLILCSAIFACPSSALAVPALPSSFYGKVKMNNANVLDGTVVEAFIGDRMVAQGYSQTYQGDSFYALDVPGDNPDTMVIDGGREGETITFKLGGVLADEAGTWHSGTSVSLNLNVTSATPLLAPQATPTILPTQTPIVVVYPVTSTPTPEIRVSTTAIISSEDTNGPVIPTSTSEKPAQPSPVPGERVPGSANNLRTTLPILAFALIVIVGAGIIIWVRRKE
jgi:hypothetical protein